MKRLLAAILALSALGAAPVAAETAEQSNPKEDQPSIWLVLSAGYGDQLHSLPMKSMEQCEEQGAIWISSNRTIRLDAFRQYLGFECLEGK